MTTFTRTPAARTADVSRREVETLLRDTAFVLSLTQRVKAEMTGDRPARRFAASAVRTNGLRLAAV